MIPNGAIGSDVWNGTAKLAEESGELVQVIAKLFAFPDLGSAAHPDGTHLPSRLEEELGDVLAAIEFVVDKNELDRWRIAARRDMKLERFEGWNENA